MRKLGKVSVLALSIAVTTAIAACGDSGGDDSGGAPDAGPGYLDPPPPANGQQLTTLEYTLQPGEEKYLCYTFYAPNERDVGIVEVQPIDGQLVHHKLLVVTTAKEPDEPFECPELIKLTWQPVWAAGAGSNGLVLPQQAAFKIPRWSQYLVQYHLQNTSDKPITERSALNLTYADDLDARQPAGLFGMMLFNFDIPAGAQGHQASIECDTEDPIDVFAVFPHMHKLGAALEFQAGPASQLVTRYSIDPWPFGDQPMVPLEFQLGAGDLLRTTCTWNNPYEHSVGFGESSDTEMCAFVLFYYPATSFTTGCAF